MHVLCIIFKMCIYFGCKIRHLLMSRPKKGMNAICFYSFTHVLAILCLLSVGKIKETIHRIICLICFSPPPHPEGSIMIHSQNAICLRPIIMPYSDNVSAGIMTAWISSAPLEWTADQFGEKRQVESHNSHNFVYLHMWNWAWNKCHFPGLCVSSQGQRQQNRYLPITVQYRYSQ